MPHYRCYFLDPKNHILAFETVDLADDTLARIEAARLWRITDSHAVELWNRAEMIFRDASLF